MSATARARQAERRLELDYERLKPETLASLSAKLRARNLRVPDADLDGYYNQAWHALYQQVAAGTEIANPGGFLVQVGFRRAIDDLRTVREAVSVELDHVAAHDDDLAARVDDQRMLREFTEALREELGDRERVAATLCYLHGYTRPEAAALMGLNERRMQKVMDTVSKAVGRITRQIQDGERCRARASQNKAYALGLLDSEGERYTLTRAHLDECARCRADVLALRGLASIAPPTLLPWAAAGAAGGGDGDAKDASSSSNAGGIITAAIAVVALGVLAATGFALTREDREPPAVTAKTTPAAPTPASGASTAQPAPAVADTTPRRADREDRDRRARERRRERRSTVPTRVTPPLSTAVSPTPTPPPPPVATATPIPRATAAPTAAPILDDGEQEFGVEPRGKTRRHERERERPDDRPTRPTATPTPAPTDVPVAPPVPTSTPASMDVPVAPPVPSPTPTSAVIAPPPAATPTAEPPAIQPPVPPEPEVPWWESRP